MTAVPAAVGKLSFGELPPRPSETQQLSLRNPREWRLWPSARIVRPSIMPFFSEKELSWLIVGVQATAGKREGDNCYGGGAAGAKPRWRGPGGKQAHSCNSNRHAQVLCRHQQVTNSAPSFPFLSGQSPFAA
eukprot:CAMPEP_0171819980 /NCGR_PEP_ID=MMETSP0992-20121227/2513_1 /TAXON_ID=483369 /ORGANISM="non described non described, Strain CCMP2098" /LENGTH=131 /DNA_ID=CAMNT_0012434321 /DNA_START=657 /DNA_END=1050 /DNA_ORIENTATION=-